MKRLTTILFLFCFVQIYGQNKNVYYYRNNDIFLFLELNYKNKTFKIYDTLGEKRCYYEGVITTNNISILKDTSIQNIKRFEKFTEYYQDCGKFRIGPHFYCPDFFDSLYKFFPDIEIRKNKNHILFDKYTFVKLKNKNILNYDEEYLYNQIRENKDFIYFLSFFDTLYPIYFQTQKKFDLKNKNLILNQSFTKEQCLDTNANLILFNVSFNNQYITVSSANIYCNFLYPDETHSNRYMRYIFTANYIIKKKKLKLESVEILK